MPTLQSKIDFAVVFKVQKANPNGDPLNGNRPRVDFGGFGEVTDVCMKRKLRDRLVDRYQNLDESARGGQAVFVQSDDRRIDGFKNLRERAESVLASSLVKNRDEAVRQACATWFDVRAFGQVFPFAGKKSSKARKTANDESDVPAEGDGDGISIPVRGPVTIQSAFSLERVEVESTQIVKSTSLEGDGQKRGSDQMGMKHRIDKAIYVSYGSINPQLAERTGFNDVDAEVIKDILPSLFQNDASSARPDGSMQVLKVIWWHQPHGSGLRSSATVHETLRSRLQADGSFDTEELRKVLPGLEPEIIDGW